MFALRSSNLSANETLYSTLLMYSIHPYKLLQLRKAVKK